MKHERSPYKELDPIIVREYAAVFVNRWDMYPVQLDDGTYVSVKKPLSLELVASHLLGELTLGAYALDPNSNSKWICFDADEKHEWQKLRKVARGLVEWGQSVFLELSRRGGHLWLFTPEISGLVVRRFAKQLVVEHNVAVKELFQSKTSLALAPGRLLDCPLGLPEIRQAVSFCGCRG